MKTNKLKTNEGKHVTILRYYYWYYMRYYVIFSVCIFFEFLNNNNSNDNSSSLAFFRLQGSPPLFNTLRLACFWALFFSKMLACCTQWRVRLQYPYLNIIIFFIFKTLKKHILAWNIVFWRILREDQFGGLCVGEKKNQDWTF